MASEVAKPSPIAWPISSLKYGKCHWSGDSITPSNDTNSAAITFLTSILLRLSGRFRPTRTSSGARVRRHRGYVLGRETGGLDHPPEQPFGRTLVVRTEHTPMLTGAVAVATSDSLIVRSSRIPRCPSRVRGRGRERFGSPWTKRCSAMGRRFAHCSVAGGHPLSPWVGSSGEADRLSGFARAVLDGQAVCVAEPELVHEDVVSRGRQGVAR